MSTIKETSEYFHLTESTLRYYEAQGLIDPVPKNESGHRVYGENEYRRLNFIMILKNAGIPIQQIQEYVRLFHEGVETIPERKQMLVDQLAILKEKRKELNQTIHELENIIENYEQTLMKRELERRKLNEKHQND